MKDVFFELVVVIVVVNDMMDGGTTFSMSMSPITCAKLLCTLKQQTPIGLR